MLKRGFRYHYMQPIKESNDKLLALEKIVKLANDKQLKVIFYIIPIDF